MNYHKNLLHDLQNPIEAQVYLNAALKDVLEAQGGDISWLAKKTNLNRENLYRILSHKGNPKLTSLKAVINALGLELAVQLPKK